MPLTAEITCTDRRGYTVKISATFDGDPSLAVAGLESLSRNLQERDYLPEPPLGNNRMGGRS